MAADRLCKARQYYSIRARVRLICVFPLLFPPSTAVKVKKTLFFEVNESETQSHFGEVSQRVLFFRGLGAGAPAFHSLSLALSLSLSRDTRTVEQKHKNIFPANKTCTLATVVNNGSPFAAKKNALNSA